MSETGSTLDETDLELLRRVEMDFDTNLEALSEDLGLSKSAIHYRLNKLREAGIIEGSTADLNPIPLGLDMVAITDIYVRHEEGYAEDIGAELAAIDGVEQVYYTMGDVDFVVIARVADRDQLNRTIDHIVSIEGVNETSSRFVMDEIKSDPTVLTNLSHDRMHEVVTDD
ncbi:MAG: Lrp/AsnC family transcriptional regulator [Haloferacaceae archaeon]